MPQEPVRRQQRRYLGGLTRHECVTRSEQIRYKTGVTRSPWLGATCSRPCCYGDATQGPPLPPLPKHSYYHRPRPWLPGRHAAADAWTSPTRLVCSPPPSCVRTGSRICNGRRRVGSVIGGSSITLVGGEAKNLTATWCQVRLPGVLPHGVVHAPFLFMASCGVYNEYIHTTVPVAVSACGLRPVRGGSGGFASRRRGCAPGGGRRG